MAEKSLKGKKAVVTGATRGLGWAIATGLIARGADVIGTGTKDSAKVPDGCRYAALRQDDPQSVEEFCAVVTREAPHILVNNAGISAPATVEDLDMAEVEHLHEINLMAPLRLCQAAAPGMKRHGWGRIVNITAVTAYYGRRARVNYGTAKAALEGLTASIAAEYAPHGILANSVAPGFIDTDVLRGLYTKTQLEELAAKVPTKRLGTAEDISSLVVWLASPENGYVTAQHIFADGGYGRVR